MQKRRDKWVMDVRLTAFSAGAQSQRVAGLLIDQTELRSVLAHFSHELGRQLASLRAGFDLVLGESPSVMTGGQRGHVLSMVSLCDDLLRFTRSSLDYAAIAQRSRPLCLGSFTIGALIDETDRQFAPIAASRGIKWESRAVTPESSVVTDASRCQQVFGNLVWNALKYTPVGGDVRIVGQADADSWQVRVSDSGPGIPAESHERVFEPFLRLARDEHSAIEGSGLGLAICRELVTQLEGAICLESPPGQGTCIVVRLPIAGPLARSGGPHRHHSAQSGGPGSLQAAAAV
jgi:signal transduction histidine kinase